MEQDALAEKLKIKLGIAGAMASHALTVAAGLKEAAAHHADQADYRRHELEARVRQNGPGNDRQADTGYCQALVERHRLLQTYELAHRDTQRFPDITPHPQHMQKSLHRLRAAAVHTDYTWGEVHEGRPLEEDDYQQRLYDPQELLPREIERDKDPEKVAYFRNLFDTQSPAEIDPVVLIRTEGLREILDGHHRWLGAKEADRPLMAAEMARDTFNTLKGAGFSDMDIAYAILAKAGCWEAADKVKSQYDGKPVRRTGFMAYEHLDKGIADEYCA